MKTFRKITLILWALTYSPDLPEKQKDSDPCDSCLATIAPKTTQTCDATYAAKSEPIT